MIAVEGGGREIVPGGRDDGPALRFGYSYGHLQALARCAVRGHAWSLGLDGRDRFSAAWDAVVECLYSAPGQVPPSSLDLVIAGRKGLSRLLRVTLRQWGYSERDPGAGRGSAPGFCRYWTSPAPASPEEQVTDRAALWQVMGRLTPVQAQALLTLAEHGDRKLASAALGVSTETFGKRLSTARAAFLALWHEGEAPSRKWRPDGTPQRPQPAGQAGAVRTLADVRAAFGGQTRVASADLLAALAAADPARYGDWDSADLGSFLRSQGIPRHRIDFLPRQRHGGKRRSRYGYWLEEVTAALADLTASVPAAA